MFTATEETVCCAPSLVLAGFDSSAARAFRRQGWDVYLAYSGPEARRLARMIEADLVILDTRVPEESGWLTCEKLTREMPGVRVVLVDSAPDSQRMHLAEFVGATALVDQRDGLAELLKRYPAEALHTAG